MSLTRLALRFAAPLPKLTGHDRYLFIGPHPDDIEIGAGASAARFAAEGRTVRFVVCIDGRYGTEFLDSGMTPEELAGVREEEAKKSAACLGVNDVRFLRFEDGGFYDPEALYRAVAAEIADFQPDVVFTVDPSPVSECHIDHLNVGRAVSRAVIFAYNKGIMDRLGLKTANVTALAFFMTAKPTRFIGTADFVKQQFSAIFGCHLSQFPKGSEAARSLQAYLTLRSADFGLRSLLGKAEGFRVLGQTEMHCLPEADPK